MIISLHIFGAIGFLLALAGSVLALFSLRINKTFMANLLVLSLAIQILSGLALVVYSSASLGRVCAASLVMAVVALPLRQRLLATA